MQQKQAFTADWLDRVLRPVYGEGDDGSERADVAAIYRLAAGQSLATRNPVIVIPGILGSRIVAATAARSIWGDFGRSHVRPGTAEDARLIALPMQPGMPLDRLTPQGVSDGSLAEVRCRFAGIPLRRRIYGTVLSALGVRGYVEAGDGEGATPGYEGAAEAAAYEFDYDWRRSLDENAIRLQRFVVQLARFIRSVRGQDRPVRFDVVAHSMGGLLLRYFLQYGGQLLPYDGSPPRATWEGAAWIDTAILIGTPNAGSLGSIERLVGGLTGNPVLPRYDPRIIGTMPSLYQLLPRTRHMPLMLEGEERPLDLLDPESWLRLRWGLADPQGDEQLARLLPGIDRPSERFAIAIDHLRKCLLGAAAFQAAMDTVPPGRPPHLRLHLFAGDSIRTPAFAWSRSEDGRVRIARHAPGDGTVLRTSALLDERAGQPWQPRLRSPIAWDSVTFVSAEHLALTHEPVTINNILYLLLEQPRPGAGLGP